MGIIVINCLLRYAFAPVNIECEIFRIACSPSGRDSTLAASQKATTIPKKDAAKMVVKKGLAAKISIILSKLHFLDVQSCRLGVGLDEFLSGRDLFSHKHGKHPVGSFRILDTYLF